MKSNLKTIVEMVTRRILEFNITIKFFYKCNTIWKKCSFLIENYNFDQTYIQSEVKKFLIYLCSYKHTFSYHYLKRFFKIQYTKEKIL